MADPINFGGFPSTHWDLVERAAHDTQVPQLALTELLQRYMPAMRTFIMRTGSLNEDQADDLLQGFLASKVLSENLLSLADPARGKFRMFLLTALNHFAISEYRREHAAKRRPGQAPLSLKDQAELSCPALSAEQMFDVAWARALLAQATERMRRECEHLHRPDIWGVFENRILLVMSDVGHPVAYEELIKRYRLKSPRHAENLLITGKRMFVRMLRAVVAEYELVDSRIDGEIADLRRILTTAGLKYGQSQAPVKE